MAEKGSIEILKFRDLDKVQATDTVAAVDEVEIFSQSVREPRKASISQLLALVTGVTGGDSGTVTVLTAFQFDDPNYQYKSVDITITNGVITDISAESAWTNVPAAA